MRKALPNVIGCALLVVLGACNNGNDTKTSDSEVTIRMDGSCHRPPTIRECSLRSYSGTMLYKCPCAGYCGGGGLTGACSEALEYAGDCRYFQTSCIPSTYTRCDQQASDFVSGLCGMCFFVEAGLRDVKTPMPKECNHLPDFGTSPTPKDGQGNTSPSDGGLTH